MSSKPTLVLVPGAWHNASTWNKVVSLMEAQQYKCVCVTLPSTLSNPSASLLDDITAVRDLIVAETTQGRDVVVVVHSYGGGVGVSAIKGLTKQKQNASTLSTDPSGHVIGVAMMASGFGATGVGFLEGIGGQPPPSWKLDLESGFAVLVAEPRELFYHDLPEEEGNYWVKELQKQALKPFTEGGEHSYAGWMDVPVWYLITMEDKVLPFQAQQYFAQMAKAAGGDITVLALLLIGVQLALLVFWSSNHVTQATVPSAVLSFLAALAILFLSHLEHSRSVQPSFILSVYLLASVSFDAVQVRTLFLRKDELPFLIASAIDFVSEPDSSRNKNYGYGLIGATGLIYFGIAITTTLYKHRVNRAVTAFRGAVVSLIYAKTLELPGGVYDESAALTLMSTDINRLAVSLDSLNEIWARIVEMSIGIWLLERQLGWVCVAPIVIVAASVYASSHVTKRIGPRQAQWVKAIQQRVSITSSMLGSMKSVKMMGLSSNLFDTLQNHRIRELNLSKHFRIMSLWRMLLSLLPPIFGPLACFVIFAIQSSREGSNGLTASKTFSSLSIISLLTAPASSFLQSLPLIGMSTGCLNRIQKFLLSESITEARNPPARLSNNVGGAQVDGSSYELEDYQQKENMRGIAVSFRDASIPPSPGSSAVLHGISFQVQKETLTMIVGIVGSGKSTLLKAIIGELKCESGDIENSHENMAYCAQSPWLPNSTVRQIICGHQDNRVDDEAWYNIVLYACAFDEDVRLLPQHDDTIIGSRGVTLSGGQKQRLALARAIYSRLSVMVFDDVLSAIDARTEKLIVERLFGTTGLLRRLNSTIILATHAVHHLSLADKVIVLGADGRIAEQGTFEMLRTQNGFVSKLLQNPELLASKSHSELETKDGPKQKQSTTVAKVLRGATANDVADLTRQIGDLSVYKYYLKSIGWKVVLANAISTLYMKITPNSGVNLHQVLLKSVMKAPQSFFDETDSGITLNRFSQDMTLVDGTLPAAAVLTFSAMVGCLAQMALIATGSSYMAITCPFLIFVLYLLQNFYLRTSRQMRFLDLECNSPLYTHFAETLEGLSTIRSFGWQRQFTATNLEHLDISQRPYYLLFCIQRWFNLFLLLIVGVIVIVVVALATSLVDSTSPGRIGVALSSVVGFNSTLGSMMLFWIQLETSLGAIARLKGFEEGTGPEDKEAESFVPSQDWPSQGAIEFAGVSASYGENSPALRDISFSIRHGEKIGICGRTGSGKSSLLSVLLRILDNSSGTITIDGLDLSTIPREIIRSRILAIPQEPFILSGTVRLNADPFKLVSDDLIIAALTKVGLWTILESRGGLDAEMTANPLSQGQQQIFCLARAMLRRGNRILVLDEATSNVDAETDGVMQRLIREEFKEWTIITVAHRLDTILDSDKILVLDKGVIVENDSPDELLARKGAFWELRGRH
ncbi:hypothetical protein G7Y89_g13720 [Cudoniella acicularis]|uniref:Uncharacterized protein n=1 Tax=Cudoniella acicularis TaxID=354080 RepID=A0A8H4R803_9HELO|nr:hypothetical protein G7Y89_g13720 [Cudoniella acicularis]